MFNKKLAIELLKRGVDEADPYKAINSSFSIQNNNLSIKDHSINLGKISKISLISVGKASVPMAQAVSGRLEIDKGLILATEGSSDPDLDSIEFYKGSHPIPSKKNLEASKHILDLCEKIGKDEIVLLLISGGGSALLSYPAKDIPLSDLQKITDMLLNSSAGIRDINKVRKHISQLKGGKLAKVISPGKSISLILSDVVGDDLEAIASGPTTPDPTTYTMAKSSLLEQDLWHSSPKSIKNLILQGERGYREETVKEDLNNCLNIIIGNNRTAVEGVEKACVERGHDSLIISTQIEGEAKDVGYVHAAISKEIQDFGSPVAPPVIVLSGGELIVSGSSVSNKLGGPNREFVLGAATKIRNKKNVVIAAIDTDGIDGKGKSGAVATGNTVNLINKSPSYYFKKHNTQECFDNINSSIDLGETGTNVNDLRIMLIGE